MIYMEEMNNIKVEVDGVEFESSPVIAGRVESILETSDKDNVAFTIIEGGEELIVEVGKQDIRPYPESKAKEEIGIGMFAMICGQICGSAASESGLEPMQILTAEQVMYMLWEEVEPKIREIMEQ
jgi:hypothetical protein